jgi:hypothetical protein
MLLHAASLKHVAYTHFWCTHSPWSGEEGTGGLASALYPDNRLKPTAEVICLINHNLLDNMVQCDRVSGPLRAFASYSPRDKKLNVFVINRAEKEVACHLVFTTGRPAVALEQWIYSGTGYHDRAPAFRQGRGADPDGDALSLTVPPVSLCLTSVTMTVD